MRRCPPGLDMPTDDAPQLTAAQLNAYLADIFPQLALNIAVVDATARTCRTRCQAGEGDLRPGGTVSGPTLFTLADCTFYAAVLAAIGKVPLAVTTSCSIDFMRKSAPGDLIADARILKLGRVLCVGDVLIHNGDPARSVAHANLTYSIPPSR